jgi:hypothetical protein
MFTVCGSSDSSPAGQTTEGPNAPASSPTAFARSEAATAPAATTSAATSPTAGTTTSGKVNANTATRAELQAAFEAAGIPGAAQWAKEVEEYRPYTSDPNFPKLRQQLAKYNPGPGVVDQLVATLAP